MLKFISVTPENTSILDQRFLSREQAGTADEPRETVEVAKNYKRAKPVVIHDDENLVAFLVYEALNPESSAFLIWDFVVHHEFQGRGYGYAIMKKLIEYLKNTYGAKRIELAIVPDNEPARTLYSKLGFEENGKINSDGELEMELYLL
jgi:diamine N-acetyltransferase